MSYVPVRLCDIHPHVLRAAARRVVRQESDPRVICDVLLAAASPSQTTYWLPESVSDIVEALTSPVTASD